LTAHVGRARLTLSDAEKAFEYLKAIFLDSVQAKGPKKVFTIFADLLDKNCEALDKMAAFSRTVQVEQAAAEKARLASLTSSNSIPIPGQNPASPSSSSGSPAVNRLNVPSSSPGGWRPASPKV